MRWCVHYQLILVELMHEYAIIVATNVLFVANK